MRCAVNIDSGLCAVGCQGLCLSAPVASMLYDCLRQYGSVVIGLEAPAIDRSLAACLVVCSQWCSPAPVVQWMDGLLVEHVNITSLIVWLRGCTAHHVLMERSVTLGVVVVPLYFRPEYKTVVSCRRRYTVPTGSLAACTAAWPRFAGCQYSSTSWPARRCHGKHLTPFQSKITLLCCAFCALTCLGPSRPAQPACTATRIHMPLNAAKL